MQAKHSWETPSSANAHTLHAATQARDSASAVSLASITACAAFPFNNVHSCICSTWGPANRHHKRIPHDANAAYRQIQACSGPYLTVACFAQQAACWGKETQTQLGKLKTEGSSNEVIIMNTRFKLFYAIDICVVRQSYTFSKASQCSTQAAVPGGNSTQTEMLTNTCCCI